MKQDDELVTGERLRELSKDREVSPEDLNTGPDTTENINEVVESDDRRYFDVRRNEPGGDCKPVSPEQVAESLEKTREAARTLSVAESDDRSAGYPLGRWPKTTAEELEHIDQPPTVLSREWKEQDPETERISKAVERMKWRNRNNFRDMDATPERDQPKWKLVTPDKETLEKLVDEARERGCTFTGTPESDEKIRKAMSGWSKERNTDFPGAKQGEGRLEKQQEEQVRDSGDVMFGVDLETQGLQGNVDPMMSREFLERYQEPIVLGPNPIITPGSDVDKETEECNKNVSDPGDYYRYGNILKRMDDTHTRKNSDYGDAAYKGYKKFGDYYFMVQLHNKYQRLESLTIGNKSQEVNDESIDDTLLDMANYAVMYLESRHRND